MKKMTSEYKAKKVLEITEEIKEIQSFIGTLEHDIMHGNSVYKSFIRKKTTFSFLGVWSKNRVTDIAIPDKIQIEINAKCLMWIDELERRIEVLIPNDLENQLLNETNKK